MTMKKKYVKPNLISENTDSKIAPLAVGVALAGGYVIGRAVKQVVEINASASKLKCIGKVILNNA